MPTSGEKFSGGYKGTPRRRHQRVSRQSGGTSGDLAIPHKTKTPVKAYDPAAPRTPVQKEIRREKHFLAPLRDTLQTALTGGYDAVYGEGGQHISQVQDDLRQRYGQAGVDLVEKALAQRDAETQNLKEDPIAELAIGTLATAGVGGIANLVRGGGTAALAAAEAQAAKVGATEAASEATGGSARAALQALIRGGASKASPVTRAIPQSVKTAAKVAARGASYPVRHPITSPLAIEAPGALIHKDPGALVKALEGKGVYGDIAGGLAGAASHISPVLGEGVSLPAAVLPSAYLTGKAGVEAAKGDSSELNNLIAEWKRTGILPALAEGDVGRAAHNLGEHPLYGLLEGSGAVNAAGRVAGAGARAIPGADLASLERKPLPVEGTGINVQREYSRDLFRQMGQRAYDRSPMGLRVRPDTFRGRHYQKEAANRFGSGQEAIRREHARQDIQALKGILPKKGLVKRLDRKSAEVVNLAVERIIQKPESFFNDLSDYKDMLEAAAKETLDNGKPRLNKRELAANRELVKQIEAGIKRGNPEHVVHAANAFIDLQQPILEELVDLKLLTPDQAEKASAIPFARVHMGAGHHEEHGVVDLNGEPLSLEAIKAEMERRGVEAPGFLSHRAPANSDFYRPSFGGATLDKGSRTGQAVASGTQMGGIEGMVRQLRRSRGLVDRARGWNEAINRFGIEVKGVDTMAEAKRVMEDPARYGLDPGINPVPVPRHPFGAKKREMEGALEHQSPALADDAASAVIANGLDQGLKGTLPDDAKIIFFPEKVAKELRADATPSGEGLKAAQAATTAFKRAVLPFSPSFYVGNTFDNLIRTTLAGINPAHFAVGAKVAHQMDQEQRAQVLAGAHFSSVDALAPHRSVEAVVTGYDPLSKSVRQFAEWSRKHGWKQAAVKAAPKVLSKASHYLLAANALLTETLPQYGVLGKVALKEMRKTQGSWTKAITHLDEASQDFAKGLHDPDKVIRLQKDLEAVYGNYTRMSPGARKVLSTITPFWTWMRAAYTYVFWNMPAHHSVATGLLAATANATRAEREQWGLNREGDKPVPTYYQGIPLPDGGVIPLANYNSFDFASDPLDALARLPFPQIRNVAEALAGRDWKGEEIKGGDGDRLAAATWAAAGAFVPFVNTLTEEEEGHKVFAPHLSLPHKVSAEKVAKSREEWEQISVPVEGSSGGSSSSAGGVDYGRVFSGGGGSSVDYSKVFSGG